MSSREVYYTIYGAFLSASPSTGTCDLSRQTTLAQGVEVGFVLVTHGCGCQHDKSRVPEIADLQVHNALTNF